MGWMNREPAEPELPSDLNQALRGLRTKLPECPRPELLQAAQSDVLPVQLSEGINKHLESCATCKALLADLEVVDSAPIDKAAQARIWKKVQSAIAAEEPAYKSKQAVGPPSNFWLPRGALAAMGVAVFVLGILFLWMRSGQQTSNEVAQNHPAVQLPTPAASVLQLDKAPVVLPASAAVVWRGQEDAAAKQIKALKRALVPYASGDYAEAARRLDLLHKQYPKMAQTPYYLGVSELFLNQNEDAARSLTGAAEIPGSPVASDALWYLALANHRLGKDEVAVSTLDTLCTAGGKNSDRACAGAKELGSRR